MAFFLPRSSREFLWIHIFLGRLQRIEVSSQQSFCTPLSPAPWENMFICYVISCFPARRDGFQPLSSGSAMRKKTVEHNNGLITIIVPLIECLQVRDMPYLELTSSSKLVTGSSLLPNYRPENWGFQEVKLLSQGWSVSDKCPIRTKARLPESPKLRRITWPLGHD